MRVYEKPPAFLASVLGFTALRELLHRWVEDWPHVKHRVHEFLDQCAQGSAALLRYVGLRGKGKLATVLNTS
jgi:hypothetical protein